MKLVPRDPNGRPLQSVEASIMDVADDITYAIHDLEDFYRSGLISRPTILRTVSDWKDLTVSNSRDDKTRSGAALAQLAKKLERDYPERFSRLLFHDAIAQLENVVVPAISDSTYSGTRDQDANLHIMTGLIISQCLENMVANSVRASLPPVALGVRDWHLIAILKELTRKFVIQTPGLAGVQRGQAKLLEELIDLTYRWVSDEYDRAPSRLVDYLEYSVFTGVSLPLARARAVIDYVAGLTDFQAAELHGILRGNSDLAGPIVR